MFLSVAVCEDEVLQRENFIKCLTYIFNNQNIKYKLYEYNSGEDLLENYHDNLDILFMDIKMNGITGMETARKIREFDITVEIIFTTAYIDYICEGYEVRAFRYLLKPIEINNLLKSINPCIDKIQEKSETISIKDKSNTIIIPIDKINYIEILNKELSIITDSDVYVTKMSMADIENKLLKKNFFRSHRSFLINLQKIKSLKGNLVIVNKYDVPVSRYKIKELKVKLAHILGDNLW